MKKETPLVSVLMGSKSDWDAMRHAHDLLQHFGVPHECKVISAHRTPDLAARYARGAARRGVKVIIAGAGGAAHVAGVIAAYTLLPVLGVPLIGWALDGMDALLSTVQMPGGVPVASVAVGGGGPMNAALFAARILALSDPDLAERLVGFREAQAAKVARKDSSLQDKL